MMTEADSEKRTPIVPATDLQTCLAVLQQGGVVAIPTDTVYGLAVMPLDAAAIDRLYAAKDRPAEKAIPMLVSSVKDAERIGRLDDSARRLCRAFWPGAMTLVAEALPSFQSPALADDGTVALRMPALDIAIDVIRRAGGVLAITSANLSGRPSALSAADVLRQLDGRIDLVLDGGPSPGGVASSVVRVRGAELELLREGALSRADLESALRA